jgi:hypothetical protein
MLSSSLSENPMPYVRLIGTLLRELPNLLLSFNECGHDHLSACLEGTIEPPDAFGKADRFEGVSTCDDNEVWIAARLKSVADLVKSGFELNCMLGTHVAVKPFRINLILQVHAGGPHTFKYPYRVHDLNGRMA